MTRFDEVQGGEAFPVSATLYTTYRKCPQQALARLHGVYQPSTVASLRGQLAHKIFARHLETGQIEERDFALVCRKEAGASLGPTMSEVKMKPSEFNAMVSEVWQLYERFAGIPMVGFIQAEAPIEVEPVEGITLRGRVDAVFEDGGETRIVDWKTGSDLSDAEPQLDFYAMVWAKAHGEPPASVEALSVRTGEKVTRSSDAGNLERTEGSVAEMINELRRAFDAGAELPRTSGPHCRWCPLLESCAEGAAAIRILG